MKNLNILIFFALLFMMGCIKEEGKIDDYNIFYFTEKPLNTLKIEGTLLNSKEQGYFKFYEDSEILSEGKFEEGLRTGIWKYCRNDSFFINWEIYDNHSKGIKINYPKEWKVTERKSSMFFARPSRDTSETNSYFILLTQNMDSISSTVKEYVKLYYNTINKNLSVDSYVGYKFKIDDREYFYFEYNITEGTKGQEVMLLSFVTHQDNKILDFSYATTYDFEMKDKTTFFQMITNCFINEERIFSPLKDLKREKITVETI